MLRSSSVSDQQLRSSLNLRDTRGWHLGEARKALAADRAWGTRCRDILCHPFDVRRIYYTRTMVDWGRESFMNRTTRDEVSLVLPKRVEISGGWQHAFVTEALVEHVAVSAKTVDYMFPLYVDIIDPKSGLYGQTRSTGDARVPNVGSEILMPLAGVFGRAPEPKHVLAYVYAILYSPTYRTRYAELLKTDFPHIPFTKDRDTFLKLAELGQQLIDLHLMRSPELDNPISRFCGKGDSGVARVNYDADHQRVYVNATQYFDGISPDLWTYQIGGYQVLDKWLKDRKGRFLTSVDTIHYSRVVTSLAATVNLQEEIDRNSSDLWRG